MERTISKERLRRYLGATAQDVPKALQLYEYNIQLSEKNQPGVRGVPGKIVAELTFGFWIDLMARHNHNVLWLGKRITNAFPNTNLQRGQIHQRLKSIQLLRNRISHHEPVLTSAKTLYNGEGFITLAELIECVEWICTETAAWMKTHFRYAEAERILDEVSASGISL